MKRNIDTYQKRRDYLMSQSNTKPTSGFSNSEIKKGLTLEQNRNFINKHFSNDMIEFMSAYDLKFLSSLKTCTYQYTKKQKEAAIQIANKVKNKMK